MIITKGNESMAPLMKDSQLLLRWSWSFTVIFQFLNSMWLEDLQVNNNFSTAMDTKNRLL